VSEKASKNDSLQVDVQCWLEEHRALTSEIELQTTSMRYMVMLNITALGTITGLVLSNTEELVLLLLIIPILSSFIGSIVYFHSRRMSQIGHYIQYKIAPKLASLTRDSEVMGWESYVREEETKRNKVSRWFSISGISLLTFIVANILALIFVQKQSFAEGAGSITLWCVGLLLTVVLILEFVEERKSWFGKETSKNV